jgi:fimbrial chaperone protein
MKRCATWLCLSLLGAGVSGGSAVAGALSVSPMRIELSARHPVATLEVTNDGADPITIQLQRMAWTQADGEDFYTASVALIATPSVFELAPHAHQVLRIALRDRSTMTAEHAYRLYAAEVPAIRNLGSTGLQMSLRVGVPVFVEPRDGESHLDGEIIARPGGRPAVLLHNTGSRYIRAQWLEILDTHGRALWSGRLPSYLLGGGEHLWQLDQTKALPTDMPLRIAIHAETGEQVIDARRSP